ncbi:MAG: sugar phosphate isomerase/epimerase, partial [Clostridia bacterium]|nr:sugar phosphate isomerase/epimerase [Clostridia bacterium]
GYEVSEKGFRQMLADLKEPVKKIQKAGLTFGYHNHAIEFTRMENGKTLYDLLREETDFHFIMDTYWVEKAGGNAVDMIYALQGRMENIHFKDMAKTEEKEICACGDGSLDFAAIIAACEATGVKNAFVEQDNACEFPDPYGEMAKSCRYLTPLVYHN